MKGIVGVPDLAFTLHVLLKTEELLVFEACCDYNLEHPEMLMFEQDDVVHCLSWENVKQVKVFCDQSA